MTRQASGQLHARRQDGQPASATPRLVTAAILVGGLLLSACAHVTPPRDPVGRARVDASMAAPGRIESGPLEGAPLSIVSSSGMTIDPVVEQPSLALYRLAPGPRGGEATISIGESQLRVAQGDGGPTRYLAAFRPEGRSDCDALLLGAAVFPHRGPTSRGTLLLLSSMVPFSPLEQSVISGGRDKGWDVLVVSGLFSRLLGFDIGGSSYSLRSIEPDAPASTESPGGAPSTQTEAAQTHAEERSSDTASGLGAGLTRDQWRVLISLVLTDGDFLARGEVAAALLSERGAEHRPLVVVGASQGALALPAVVAHLRTRGLTPSAAVFVAGGCDVGTIAGSAVVTGVLDGLGCTLSADERSAVAREATRHDPLVAASACDGMRVLMVSASHDDAIPASCRARLRSLLGEPEHWEYPVSHATLFVLAPIGWRVMDWIDAAGGAPCADACSR